MQTQGKFNNNIIDYCGYPEPDEPLIICNDGGPIIANLDGWAIIPKAEYERIKACFSG